MGRFDGIRSVHYQDSDPGLVWTKDPEPCIGPDSPLDSLSILTPNVVRLPTGGYRLYYTGWGPGRAVPDANGYILSAVSDDGAAWRKEPGVRLDAHEPDATLRVLCPDVVPLPDGRWRMYFEAATPDRPNVIKSAVSPDGLAWEPEPGVRAAAPDASFGSPRCVYVASRRRTPPGSAAGSTSTAMPIRGAPGSTRPTTSSAPSPMTGWRSGSSRACASPRRT